MSNEQTSVKSGFSKRRSTYISLIVYIAIFAFCFGPGITGYTLSYSYIMVYQCANYNWNGASGGLTSAFIFLGLGLLFCLINLILSYVHPKDRKGNKLGGYIGDASCGVLEILESICLLVAGLLFCFTHYFGSLNLEANGGILVNGRTSFIGWAAIVVAILCFALCIYVFFEGLMKIQSRSRAKAIAEAEYYK